ncbi:YraN family protein, partial [Patescibacteria group bacterium]|nr:YraN family protein [Patescibacteria group bacterium]
KIIERNWRCKLGEIDLIIKKDLELRFIEVKTRSSSNFGYPEQALTETKKRHFFNAIEYFLSKNKIHDNQAHADILAIIINHQEFDIRWLPDCI